MTPPIYVTNETLFPIDLEKVEQLSRRVLQLLGLAKFELSITCVSSEAIQALNLQYRQKNCATDVLSFPLNEWTEPVLFGAKELSGKTAEPLLLGDIVLAPEIARTNAETIGQSWARELSFLIVHSILHLAGHDHVVEPFEQLMLEQQRKIMSVLDTENLCYNIMDL